MKKVFLVHGFKSWPNGGWRPWLMAELNKQSVFCQALAMPSPNNPNVSEWVKEIARNIDLNIHDQIYLVGHSLGVPAILRYLQGSQSKNIKGVVFVSSPIFKAKKKKVGGFLNESFDFQKIKPKVKRCTVIHGSNDRAVPIEQGRELAKQFGVELIVVKNGGHLNGSSGWTSLPEVLDALNEMFGID